MIFHGTSLLSNILINYVRYFPDHPSKLRLARGLINSIFPSGLPVQQGDAKITIDCADYIGWSILSSGSYEPKTLELAKKILSAGGVFIDIGANFGLYTCCLGSISKVKCMAIEPAARAFIALQKNVDLNSAIDVKLYNVALGASHGLVDIEDIDPGNMGKVRILLNDKSDSGICHIVSMIPLRDLVHHAQLPSITLIKIDVEGYELPILKGFDWSSSLRPQHVIAEFTDYSARADGVGRQSLLEFFQSHDYLAYSVNGQPIETISKVPDFPEDNIWFRDNKVLTSS